MTVNHLRYYRLLLRGLRSNWSVDDTMKLRVLPKDADLEVDSEAVHTWVIDDWRHLEKKSRGPKFQCGGHPWCVRSEFGIRRPQS